jgi:Glycosyltransferase Family 4
MIRVAMITGEYPPMEGGVGAFTHMLSMALMEAGHTVAIFTDRRAIGDHSSAMPVNAQIDNWNWGMRQLRSMVRDFAPDVVNLQYEAAAYRMQAGPLFTPALLAGLPVVVTFHDLLVPYLFPKAGPVRHWAVHQLARRAASVIVTNMICKRWAALIGYDKSQSVPISMMHHRTAMIAWHGGPPKGFRRKHMWWHILASSMPAKVWPIYCVP